FDWLAVDNIKLTGEPFQTEAEVTGQSRFTLKAIDGTALRIASPPNGDAYELIYWDVSNLKGRTVYLEAADGMDAEEEGWLAFGAPFSFNHKDVVEDGYWSFESGTYADWDRTGDAFGAEPNSRFLGRPLGSGNGKYWADSLAAGEDKTGTMTSKPFVVDKPILSFLAAGWNGQAGWNPPRNYYELIDENGQRLRLATPPGQSSQPLNQFIAQYWDVSDLIGETVRFRVVDGDSSSGYAWLALDSIHLMDNRDFEMGSYASWQTVGAAFGAEPESLGQSAAARGARGSRWSDSSSGGANATGTLTSEPFRLEGEWLSFLAAGYADGGANYYRLLAADGQELDRVSPPNGADFVSLKLHAPGKAGTLVRFEAVDGSASETEGWLAYDDLNERRLLPDKLTLRLSQEGAQWSDAAVLNGVGATRLAYELPGTESYRYVQILVEGGRVDAGFLQMLQLRQPVSRWTDGALGQNGTLDLGQIRSVNGLKLQFATAWTRSFTVETSVDGQTWSPAYKAIADAGASVQVVFTETNARYIRLAGLPSEIPTGMTAQVVAPPALNLQPIPVPSDGGGGTNPEEPNQPSQGNGTTTQEPADIRIAQAGGVTTLTVKATAKSVTEGGSVAELTAAQWKALVKLAAEKAVGQRVHIVVEVSAPDGDVREIVLRLPSGAAYDLEWAEAWTLEAIFPSGRLSLDEKATAELAAAAGQGPIEIGLGVLEPGAAQREQASAGEAQSGSGQAAAGKSTGAGVRAASVAASGGEEAVYRFSLKANGLSMTTLAAGKAKIALPYVLGESQETPAVVAYASWDDGTRQVLRGGFDAARGEVAFVTGELASFTIGYNKVEFRDVPDGVWYGEPAAYLAARSIVLGKGSGLFAPADSVTRAEFVVMVMRAYGIAPAEDPASSFDDAGSGYSAPYLAEAKRLGLVNGVGGNRFAPAAAMSRQDMLVILHRMLSRLNELPVVLKGDAAAVRFRDEAKISAYAREAVLDFAAAGSVIGYRDAIDPHAV
ncbi:S-layer homology domain-containing protein, partial [Paenibacillus agaridevorans]|uniref:S-layer homology domain-containing protein n=1 Tax=Paenibacillus agaridevorans TaxID=171404 RepID=UPI0015E80F02